MASVQCLKSSDLPAFPLAVEAEAVKCSSGSGAGNGVDSSRSAVDSEWHAIPLEDPSRPEMEFCFHVFEGKQSAHQSRKLELSMCGLPKHEGGDDSGGEKQALVRKDCSIVVIKEDVEAQQKDGGTAKEVRLSFHSKGVDSSKKGSGNNAFKKVGDDSAAAHTYGEDACLPFVHQVRAFIKGAKLSRGSFLSGMSKSILSDGWRALLQRSFSFNSFDTQAVDSEATGKQSTASPKTRCTSQTALVVKIPVAPSMENTKSSPLQARDPQSRADALPLAHYRPTDGCSRKDGDVKAAQATSPSPIAGNKSPGHNNCKKPPKPPRYPGRSTSLDSANVVAQRSARKSRDRAFAKRKLRSSSVASSPSITPLVALLLTLGFGVLMVFQGVFVQTNVPSYGRSTGSRAFMAVATAANSHSSFTTERVASYVSPFRIDPRLASSNADVSKTEAVLSNAFYKSMQELPWSRSSLGSQVRVASV